MARTSVSRLEFVNFFFTHLFPPTCEHILECCSDVCVFIFAQDVVSQPPGRGPVPGPGINYSGSRDVLLEFCHFSFLSNFHE